MGSGLQIPNSDGPREPSHFLNGYTKHSKTENPAGLPIDIRFRFNSIFIWLKTYFPQKRKVTGLKSALVFRIPRLRASHFPLPSSRFPLSAQIIFSHKPLRIIKTKIFHRFLYIFSGFEMSKMFLSAFLAGLLDFENQIVAE